MKIFREIFKFYIDASMHVALAVACVTGITFLKFGLDFDLKLCGVSFFATVVSYNFMKYGTNAKSYFIVSSLYLKIIQLFSFLGFGMMVWLIWFLKFEVLMVLGLSGLFTAIYALPLLPGNQSFRSLHGLKIYMVAFCWALITVIIPIIDAERSIDRNVCIEFVQRFLIVLALIIPFDIRDLKNDSLSLGTLPQQLGVQRAKYIGYTLVLLFFLSGLFQTGSTSKDIYINGIVSMLVFAAIYFAKKNQPPYYCSFFVESIPILWFLPYLFF